MLELCFFMTGLSSMLKSRVTVTINSWFSSYPDIVKPFYLLPVLARSSKITKNNEKRQMKTMKPLMTFNERMSHLWIPSVIQFWQICIFLPLFYEASSAVSKWNCEFPSCITKEPIYNNKTVEIMSSKPQTW